MGTEIQRYRRLMADPDYDNYFVFGSNLSGVHGAGAAAEAHRHYGAVYGKGMGFTGKSYAIPTKGKIGQGFGGLATLPIDEVGGYVEEFLTRAWDFNNAELLWPDMDLEPRFIVTRIGCGLAGYKDAEIAPMFKGAPPNCVLPDEWKEYL